MTPDRILAVDVGTGRATSVVLADPTIGSGLLGALLLASWQRRGGRGPAPVVLAAGGLHGVPTVGGATATVCGRSPQSGGYAEARVEGRLGGALRAGGLRAVVLHGRAAQSSVVGDGRARTVPAGDYAGWDAAATTTALSEHWPDAVIGAVGPAAEQGSTMASIVFDWGFPTATGGLGGALGALGVKGLVITPAPTTAPDPADHRAGRPLAETVAAGYAARIADNPLAASQLDPPGFGVPAVPRLVGYQAGHNFSPNGNPKPDTAPSPTEFAPFLTDGPPGCPGCPQHCLKLLPAPGRPPECGRLHQQAIAIWTDQLGISDPRSALEFNADCHRFGLEHVSVGAVLGALAQAAGAGIVTTPAFEFGDAARGLDLLARWGSGAGGDNPRVDGSRVDDPRAGGTRSDDTLADRAARAGAASYLVAVRGMPLPPFDPRGSQGLAAAMVLNPAGPRYDVVEHDIDFDPAWAWERHVIHGTAYGLPAGGLAMGDFGPERVRSVIGLWELWSGLDAMGVCLFASPPTRELALSEILALLSEETGSRVTMAEVTVRGRQRLSVQRQVNARWGIGESQEVLPDRFFDEPIGAGPLAGVRIDRHAFAAGLAHIRAHFGWSDAAGGADDRDGVSALAGTIDGAEVYAA